MAAKDKDGRYRIKLDASDYLVSQLAEVSKLLGVPEAAAARFACAEGATLLIARYTGPQPVPGGAPHGPLIDSSSSGSSKDEYGPHTGTARGPDWATKDGADWTAHDVQREVCSRDVKCPRNAAHGRLVVRWSEKTNRWLAGCPTYAEKGCKGTWSPAKDQKAAARTREAEDAERKTAERSYFTTTKTRGGEPAKPNTDDASELLARSKTA